MLSLCPRCPEAWQDVVRLFGRSRFPLSVNIDRPVSQNATSCDLRFAFGSLHPHPPIPFRVYTLTNATGVFA